MTSLGDVDSLLREHQKKFGSLVERAQLIAARGNENEAAARVQLAAAYAWLNHAGVFASPALEDVLHRLSLRVPPSPLIWNRGSIDVLHVVTQVYETGGPTQAIARWIDQDAGRRHVVCLTQQGAAPLPEKILARTRRGQDLVNLSGGSRGLISVASSLRGIAGRASVVVVHTHPHDVVATLALAAEPRTGLINVNHADHVFWLGTGIPGMLFNMRDSGRQLATDRRGVAPGRSVVMARPLSTTARTQNRATAKESLGIRSGTRLIVTAADAAKYQQIDGPSFLELLLPVVQSAPDILLLAAGPSRRDDWLKAEGLSEGRIRALGRLSDPSVLQQAADVYVDSFPFASLTSLLEAGSYGTPVVTYRGHPDECAVLGADTPGVDPLMVRPRTPGQFHDEMLKLLEDTPYRVELGEQTCQAILGSHTGSGWHKSLEGLYAVAADPPSEGEAPTPTQGTGPLDTMVTLVQSRNPFHGGVLGAAKFALPYFPAGARFRLWTALVASGNLLSPSLILPPHRAEQMTIVRRALGIRRPKLPDRIKRALRT